MEKRRKIFDGDGTTVTEVISTKPKKKAELEVNTMSDNFSYKPMSHEIKKIKVEDVLDTFAGYLPATVNFMTKDSGECLICGKETSSSMRKICFSCLSEHGEELYNKAKKSIEMGDKEFQI